MNNITTVSHSNAQNELSKLEGDMITITSYGQQLASWGKTETSGLLLRATKKRKLHKLHLLQESEINEFTSNGYQHQFFIVDNGISKLFVHNDNNHFTQDEIKNLTK